MNHPIGRRLAPPGNHARSPVAAIWLGLLAAGALLAATSSARPLNVAAAGAVVIGSAPRQTINAQYDTQHVWPGQVNQVKPGTGGITALDRLSALKGPIFRIHAGTDGGYAGTTCSNGVPPALPFDAPYTSTDGICVAAWDFRQLNRLFLDSNDAGAGSTVSFASNTLTDMSKNWQPSLWAGRRVTVGSQSLLIADNTATTLTLTSNWAPLPAPAAAYVIPATSGVSMMNNRYFPDSMYGGSGPMGGNAASEGGILDETYDQEARYMATLVGYYNKGISPPGANPAAPPPGMGGIRYWEIYNEPNYAPENPRIPPVMPTPTGITLAGATVAGGSLTAGSTYSYQVAAVTTAGGASTPASAPQSITLSVGQNAVQVKIPRKASFSKGKTAPGYAIYGRGSSPVYMGFAGRDSGGGGDLIWVDNGSTCVTGCSYPIIQATPPRTNGTGGEAPLDPLEYKKMWDMVVPAMKAVDPTIKVVGPVANWGGSVVTTKLTAAPDDVSWTDNRAYIEVLMSSANKPDVISWHDYGGWTAASESSMLSWIDDPSNPQAIVQDIQSNVTPFSGSTPLFMTETAPTSAFGDPRNLEAQAFGAAWYARLFAHLAPLTPSLTDLFQFTLVNSSTLGLIAEPGSKVPDPQEAGPPAGIIREGNPYLVYWALEELNRAFPKGSRLLPVSNIGPGLDVMAALVPPTFTTARVLIVNRQPAGTCCAGAPASVPVQLSGLNSTATTMRMVDANTSLVNGPTTTSLGAVSSPTISFGGYGFAVLEFATGSGSGLPTFTSASSTTCMVGSGCTFNVTATGPLPISFSESGPLPAGIRFSDNGNGTASLAGVPATGSAGTYGLTITATNSNGSTPQSFVITVTAASSQQAPTITSPAAAAFTVGSAGAFTITSSGSPAAALSQSGTLPAGLSFLDNGNGTATVSGTPRAGTGGVYPVVITATNPAGSANQSLSLTVNQVPSFTSSGAATFTVGASSSFAVTTSGFSPAALTVAGALPSGIKFTDAGTGAGTLTGTPAAGTAGTYPVKFTATNAAGSIQQNFVLTIIQPVPAVDSPNQAPTVVTQPVATAVNAGTPATFSVTAAGNPTPTFQWQVSGDGGTNFKDIGGATNSTLTIVPVAGDNAETYRAVLTNPVGSVASRGALLTVYSAPVLTSSPSTGALVPGQSFTLTSTATANPPPTWQWQISTDGGRTFTDIPGASSGINSPAPSPGTGRRVPVVTASLKLTATQAINGYSYRAVFGNDLGTVTSAAVTLAIDPPGSNPPGSNPPGSNPPGSNPGENPVAGAGASPEKSGAPAFGTLLLAALTLGGLAMVSVALARRAREGVRR